MLVSVYKRFKYRLKTHYDLILVLILVTGIICICLPNISILDSTVTSGTVIGKYIDYEKYDEKYYISYVVKICGKNDNDKLAFNVLMTTSYSFKEVNLFDRIVYSNNDVVVIEKYIPDKMNNPQEIKIGNKLNKQIRNYK